MRTTSISKLQRQLSAGHFESIAPEERGAQLLNVLKKYSRAEMLCFISLGIALSGVSFDIYRTFMTGRSLSVAPIMCAIPAPVACLVMEQSARRKIRESFSAGYERTGKSA